MKALKLAIQFSRLHQVLKLGGPGKQQKATFNDNLWLNGIFWHETKILLLVDSDGIVMYASQQMTALLGLMQVGVGKLPVSDLVCPCSNCIFIHDILLCIPYITLLHSGIHACMH
jgi:PAS domain-containing protein